MRWGGVVGVGEWVAWSGLELSMSATSESVLLLGDRYHGMEGQTVESPSLTTWVERERERAMMMMMMMMELNIKRYRWRETAI